MKKWIASFLVFALLLAALPISALAATPGYTVELLSNGGSSSETYYYTDDYFAAPASLYNSSLATMSFYATLAGMYADTATGILKSIGFGDLVFNEDYKQPSVDTMGTVIGHKTIVVDDIPYTLLLVDTRGGTTFTEWAGNFTMGASGNHYGFNLAAEAVMRSVNAYVAEYGQSFESKAIKLWTTGFSRSGVAVNLFAAELTDDVRADAKVDAWGDDYTLTTENIYAYTFEAPRAGTTAAVSVADAEQNYTNIHNIVNPADLVTLSAPAEYGFVRYGVDENVIPQVGSARYNELYDAMLGYFLAIDNANVQRQTVYDDAGKPQHLLSTFTGKKLTTDGIADTELSVEDFLDSFYTEVTTAVGSRANYADALESSMRGLLVYVFEYMDITKLPAFFETYRNLLEANISELVTAALLGNGALEDLLVALADEAAAETDCNILQYADIKAGIKSALPYLARLIAADLIYSGGTTMLTFIENTSVLFSAHYPELCMAWLQANDSNYNPDAPSVTPKYCVYEKATPIKVGTYQVTIDKVTKNLTLIGSKNGFYLFSTVDGAYVALDKNGNAVLSDTAFEWRYNGGFYGTASSRLARLFSALTKKYLTFTAEGFGTSASAKTATFTETVRSAEHSLVYTDLGAEGHRVVCSHCGTEIESCAAHSFEGDTCVCGRLSDEAAAVTAVSVNKARQFSLLTTKYKFTLSVTAKYAVKSVQYSTDGGKSWSSGTSFILKKAPDLLIKVTDALGHETTWFYSASTGAVTAK